MVFGILTATAACPAIIGTTEAVRHGQKKNNREEHRGRKCHLRVTLLKRSRYDARFRDAPLVLKDGKIYVDTRQDVRENDAVFPATINFLEYPGGKKQVWKKAGYALGEGMVTMINDDRVLNWVFVDKDSGEVRYGIRKDADPHMVGPWDCTKFDRRLTFQGWEGFIAVQEADGDEMWALYFDCRDDGLTGPHEDGIGTQRKRMLEVEIWRKEIRRHQDAAMTERMERLDLREEISTSEA